MGQSHPIPYHTIAYDFHLHFHFHSHSPVPIASPGPSPSPISIAALIAKALNIPTRNQKKSQTKTNTTKTGSNIANFYHYISVLFLSFCIPCKWCAQHGSLVQVCKQFLVRKKWELLLLSVGYLYVALVAVPSQPFVLQALSLASLSLSLSLFRFYSFFILYEYLVPQTLSFLCFRFLFLSLFIYFILFSPPSFFYRSSYVCCTLSKQEHYSPVLLEIATK